MNIQFIKSRIQYIKPNWDILIFKGFSIEVIKEIANDYLLLDDYIYEDNKIDLSKIDGSTLLMKIMTLDKSQKAIISFESWLNLTNNMRNINLLKRDFCIFENNLLKRIKNPTTSDIPDYESDEFQDIEYKEQLSCLYYSNCSHRNGVEYVEYFDCSLDDPDGISSQKLVNPLKISPEAIDAVSADGMPKLSIEDDSINDEFESIHYEGKTTATAFIIDRVEFNENKELYYTLASAAHLCGREIHLHYSEDQSNISVRPELLEILKEIWGYDSFRSIKIYQNLYRGKKAINVSQGEIIENVILQAEKALLKKRGMNNVLLTAPTGSGKSILFQIPAIYLARKYQCLTIVISPLVALMNDQVDNLELNYEGVATLNSIKTAQQKTKTIDGIQSGKINLLYLSPELLLSYNISMFIGTRKIGLVVIDEAHTVTTWGRDFRVDYWFLGDYLRNCQRYLKYKFPIFAVTATAVWDPSKKNDMVFDTIRSLNMDPCIKYIGVVKRDNIVFDISNPIIISNYEDYKMGLAREVAHDSIDTESKTIIYFPYRSSIWTFFKREDSDHYKDKIAMYHAALPPHQKEMNANDFKSGLKPVICATKAYGMGIDVADIKKVYHYSPTGNLSDYVQEIGRLARNPEITGIAKIDFTDKDFRFTRTLHGLSAIKSYQLKAVLKKLMEIYYYNGERRNMLITSNDFAYIFPGKDVDYDQKLKSCLLLISNDLLNKYHFHSLIVRPKSLFTNMYFQIGVKDYDNFCHKYKDYIKQYDSNNYVVVMDCEKLWTDTNCEQSFPSFKHNIYDGKVFRGFHVQPVNHISINLHAKQVSTIQSNLEKFFDIAENFLSLMAETRKRLPINDMIEMLPKSFSKSDKENFVEAFKMLYVSFKNDADEDNDVYCNLYHINDAKEETLQLMRHGYEAVKNKYLDTFVKHIHGIDISTYCESDSHLIKLAELINLLELGSYLRAGGDCPAIFVRINNPAKLGDLVRSDNYQNAILNNIYDRYTYAEHIFSYFFTTPMTDKMRWDFIEDYFLGAEENTLLNYKEIHEQ